MADLGGGTTGYPTVLDTNPTPEGVEVTDSLPGEGAIAAVIALETIIGVTPSGNKATIKAFIQAEHDLDGEHTLRSPHSFFQDNVAASQTAVVLKVAGSATVTEIEMPWAGSVVGISVVSNEARTANTLTVDATVNGTVTGLQAVLDGTNTTHHSASQAKDLDVFAAGDRLGCKITTGAWTPTTADILVMVYVTFN